MGRTMRVPEVGLDGILADRGGHRPPYLLFIHINRKPKTELILGLHQAQNILVEDQNHQSQEQHQA